MGGAWQHGRADDLRSWLRQNVGAHRDPGVALRAVFFARGRPHESLCFELAVAALRAAFPGITHAMLASTWANTDNATRGTIGAAAFAVKAAIEAGTVADVLEAIASGPDAERLRPVIEAVRGAIGNGSLAHLAPEIREPAEHLLRFFQMKIEHWEFEPVTDAPRTDQRSPSPAAAPKRSPKPRSRPKSVVKSATRSRAAPRVR